MRWRRWIWLALGLLCWTALWRWNGHVRAPRPSRTEAVASTLTPPVPQATAFFNTNGSGKSGEEAGASTHRLRNTPETIDRLLHNDRAILLENALLDTGRPLDLPIPAFLRAQGDPGSYIVQSRRPLSGDFRNLLKQTGASIIAYIPNNAYLVRASAGAVQSLASNPETQAVIPYEAYYKLKPSLLEIVLEQYLASYQQVHPAGGAADPDHAVGIRLLLFGDGREQVLSALGAMGVPVLAEGPSPFGPVLNVRCAISSLPELAQLPSVEELELWHKPVPAIDLSRSALGISTNSTTPANYLDLSGSNVVVNVNDNGVDTNHPDLAGRVLVDESSSGLDTNGHGTHMAGIIAGSGLESLSVTNAPGSSLPAGAGQFRGLAPAAKIFATHFAPGAFSAPEAYLLASVARSNVFISNNSWHYADDNEYDLAAATCDAGVRDALPGSNGAQPVLCVFAGGNCGLGSNDGTGGVPGSIQSPATAKNVITVGAVEHLRWITNQTWTCTNSNGCQTNTPWLGLTDADSQVASFSSRGNVGAGVEGPSGRFKPDVVAPGVFVLSARSSDWDQAAYYSSSNRDILQASMDDNYFAVLSNLNESAGPFYRFESGTSVAAAEVSGTLALMQEFFEQRLGVTNSPALMKALLINGARPLGAYDFSVRGGTNSQGWGLVQLPNSAPASLTNLNGSSNSMFFLDQNPARALATGQSQTRFITVSPAARSLPLRVTLAWSDPPANPVAGLKLVNDLDLVLTNLDTGAVFFGNDFQPGQPFSSAWNTATEPNQDRVNNVENVWLGPPLSGNYSITVLCCKVNVNVVPQQEDVAQDYALVISSGDGQVPNALTMSEQPLVANGSAPVTMLTNQFLAGTNDLGCILRHERVGAGAPLLSTNAIPLTTPAGAVLNVGSANQWHFYVVTNNTPFTNAAFLTFVAPPISADGAGLLVTNRNGNNNPEADIDLYVSTDPGLTNLDPAAVANADKSLGRGASETITYSNAFPGVYYIGVKCESQEGAEYNFMAMLSELPFAWTDPAGNQVLRGFPAPAAIPAQGSALVMCVEPNPVFFRRVVVTNELIHPALAEVQAVLTHGGASATLLNHSGVASAGSLIFDDSGQGDIPSSRRSDGPGTLRGFAGTQGAGQWLFTLLTTNQAGTNDSLWISLEPQPDISGGLLETVLPGACREDFISVPPMATNLAVGLAVFSGTGPVLAQLYPATGLASNSPTLVLGGVGSNAVMSLDNTSLPPLAGGSYALRLCNGGPDPMAVNISSTVLINPSARPPLAFSSPGLIPIPDDAVTSSAIWVTNPSVVSSAAVGVRLDHPRVSDLALHLVSPTGTRVLLQENRGGGSVEGMGTMAEITNMTTVPYSGGPEAFTNVLETGQNAGTLNIDYDMYSLPDEMTIYYDGHLIFDSGFISNSGHTNVNYGPGASTLVIIVMNQNGNPSSDTAWWYRISTTRIAPVYVTFTEDTNLASIPIKFAPPPFTNINYVSAVSPALNGIYYLPEESLGKVSGEPAGGQWTLEIEDRRAGATNPPPMLVSWELQLVVRDPKPMPISLMPATAQTNLLGPGQLQWFAVNPPAVASFATNRLLFANAPVNLLFNPAVPPTGTNATDVTLLFNSRSGAVTLRTNGTPAFTPGSLYYLGVQNTNVLTVTFAVETDFDWTSLMTLPSASSYSSTNLVVADYYRFVSSTNAVRVQFELNGPTADLALVARQGLPLPTLNSFDYVSAYPGTNDQLIVVYDFSTPVPLSAGQEWFLGVINLSGRRAAYSILATEFFDYGTNLVITGQVITNNSLCLTWGSLPGIHYLVQGKPSLGAADWTTVSPTITARDYTTTYCIALPSSFQFFRVIQGITVNSPPLLISSISNSINGVRLRWTAAPVNSFQVQWTPWPASPGGWSPFTNSPAWTNGGFEFWDDGSQSGGAASRRFYRLLRLP